MTPLDLAGFALFAALYAGYHWAYVLLPRRWGLVTRESRIMAYRVAWYRDVLRNRQPLVAIQLLRNLVMAHTFFGTMALVVMGGVFSYLLAQFDLMNVAVTQGYGALWQGSGVPLKMLAALVLLLVAFLNFAMGIRVCFNLNFILAVPQEALGDTDFPVEMLRRQSRHFILGVRSLYFTGPVFLWAFHPLLLMVGSALITLALFRFDFLKRGGVPLPRQEDDPASGSAT